MTQKDRFYVWWNVSLEESDRFLIVVTLMLAIGAVAMFGMSFLPKWTAAIPVAIAALGMPYVLWCMPTFRQRDKEHHRAIDKARERK